MTSQELRKLSSLLEAVAKASNDRNDLKYLLECCFDGNFNLTDRHRQYLLSQAFADEVSRKRGNFTIPQLEKLLEDAPDVQA